METKRCSSVRDECLTNGDICKSKRRWAVKFESFFFFDELQGPIYRYSGKK